MITRRRFIALSAAFAASPVRARTQWRGLALGAQASITLRGPAPQAQAALAAARAALEEAEALFSLYRPASWLSGLNRRGRARTPPQARALLGLCERIHHLTEGLFDPTVQPLWIAAQRGDDLRRARERIGWTRVRPGAVTRLGAGQMLTLNGVAQGWATDRVADVLTAHGFPDALVNVGEFRADAGDWRIGVADPQDGLVRSITLSGGAVATSSPFADQVGGHPHIFAPGGGAPTFSTVSVEARTAALADGVSTALCLADRAMAARLAQRPEIHAITLVAPNGDVAVLR